MARLKPIQLHPFSPLAVAGALGAQLTMILALFLAGCQGPAAPSSPTDLWDSACREGPALVGIVRHPDGHPLEGIEVTPHGGIATRFPGKPTYTDEHGRYRLAPVRGRMKRTRPGEEPTTFVGVCVGSVRGVNPPTVLPWKDITLVNRPGTVARLDFVFDPESVPLEYRTDVPEPVE
jgi:hypothetical protein